MCETCADHRMCSRGSTGPMHLCRCFKKAWMSLQPSLHVSGKGKWYRVWCRTSLFLLTENPMSRPCGLPPRTPQGSLLASWNGCTLILERAHEWLASYFALSVAICKWNISVCRSVMEHIHPCHDTGNFLIVVFFLNSIYIIQSLLIHRCAFQCVRPVISFSVHNPCANKLERSLGHLGEFQIAASFVPASKKGVVQVQ